MFEQTFVNQNASRRKPWTMAVSLAGQTIIVAAAVIIPVLHTEMISMRLPMTLYAPLPPSRPVEVPLKNTGRAAQARPPRVFVLAISHGPTRIPTRIAMIDEAPLLLPGALPVGPGSPAGAGALGDFFPPGAVNAPVKPPAPEPAKPKPVQAIRVASVVQGAKLIHEVKPLYPPLAKAARISGTVRIRAVIGRDGTIRDLQLISGPPLLVEAALNAVKQLVYKPTLLNGEPVEVITQIDVNYILGG
ncbi:MAG: energy transducer TonB [Acidobacteriota bacterium]|nr:energy transducer TonB [Acidobacteriota bacterium]